MKVVIDRRPITRIIIEKSIYPLIYLIIFGLFFYIVNTGTLQVLPDAGRKALAVFILCASLWIGQVIPVGITGLLAIVLLPLLGIMSAKESYSLFGNQAIFFLIGAFILGAAIQTSGLAIRIALLVLNNIGKTPSSLLLSIFVFSFFMSWFMPEHVVAAISFPIVLELIRGLGLTPRNNFAKSLFFSLAWGCITGGVATPLGGARVPLAMGIIQEVTGKTFTFLDYMKFSAPVSILTGIAGFLLIRLFYKIGDIDLSKGRDTIQRMIRQQGLMSFREKMIAIISTITILFWLFGGQELGLANIAIISVVSLFVFQLIRWKEVQENVNWGVILMYGGAIALGGALDRSGASEFIATKLLFKEFLNEPLKMVAGLALLTIVFTEFVSNSAVVAAFLPIGLGISKAIGLDAELIGLTIAFNSGLAFSLPIGTPSTAIVYSSGYLKLGEMAKIGAVMIFISWIIFVCAVKYFYL